MSSEEALLLLGGRRSPDPVPPGPIPKPIPEWEMGFVGGWPSGGMIAQSIREGDRSSGLIGWERRHISPWSAGRSHEIREAGLILRWSTGVALSGDFKFETMDPRHVLLGIDYTIHNSGNWGTSFWVEVGSGLSAYVPELPLRGVRWSSVVSERDIWGEHTGSFGGSVPLHGINSAFHSSQDDSHIVYSVALRLRSNNLEGVVIASVNHFWVPTNFQGEFKLLQGK